MNYDGIDGLWLDDNGALHVETASGVLVDDAPYIYQENEGLRTEVLGRFELIDNDTYTFHVTGDYDSSLELVIDPNIDWSTYLEQRPGTG